jgi:hypothetical protein
VQRFVVLDLSVQLKIKKRGGKGESDGFGRLKVRPLGC